MGIFRDSLRAFVDGDAQLALQLKPRDRHLDGLNARLSDKLADRMVADPEQVPTYLNIIFIARFLERIGDHATNIAEDAFWQEQAEDIRHTLAPLRRSNAKAASFRLFAAHDAEKLFSRLLSLSI